VSDENRVDPGQQLQEFRRRTIGRPVTYRRLAGNSVLVYVDATPGSRSGVTFWLEPTWQLRGPERVLTGSREAQRDDGAADPDAGFRRAAAALDSLSDRTVLDVRVEPITGDLVMEFEGGFILRTFVSDPTDDEIWHIRDNSTSRKLIRAAAGFAIASDA
jgi:hypothetical protein